jgi:transcriptional regulator with XRE-family HTH domain
MDSKEIESVISEVISEAIKAKGWSLAKLTRYLGKGSNTLHRWRSGQTSSYDMEALVELFKMAQMSMDEAFGLTSAAGDSTPSGGMWYESLSNEIDRIELELAYLRPLARLADAFSSVVAAPGRTGARTDAKRLRLSQTALCRRITSAADAC